DDACPARRDGAGADRVRVGVTAVPYPAADRRHAVTGAGPREQWVPGDLPLHLELPGLLAVGTEVAGGDEGHVGRIDDQERVLIVTFVAGGIIADLVDLGEGNGAVQRDGVSYWRAVVAYVDCGPLGVEQVERVRQPRVEADGVAAAPARLCRRRGGEVAVDVGRAEDAGEGDAQSHDREHGERAAHEAARRTVRLPRILHDCPLTHAA